MLRDSKVPSLDVKEISLDANDVKGQSLQ
jgi:hypothetical protein